MNGRIGLNDGQINKIDGEIGLNDCQIDQKGLSNDQINQVGL